MAVTQSPEAGDKTIDFTFGLLRWREAGELTHPVCEEERDRGWVTVAKDDTRLTQVCA